MVSFLFWFGGTKVGCCSGLWDIPDPKSLERHVHQESLLVLQEFQNNIKMINSKACMTRQ
ncbi:hypothetical protein ACFOWU_07890 [Epilithonimonas zeae]|uniref:hypothetical protein n=1 Tax=Epilithonimonas zeae TaxID=1416779 RepID=UPI00111528D4|nr:hypothetical protein [Epilithonimonas zeae]